MALAGQITLTCAGPSTTTCLMNSGGELGSINAAVKTVCGGGGGVLLATVSAQVLLLSLVSETALFGSTEHAPPARGFVKVPDMVGIAENDTSKEPLDPIVTVPEAVQVRSSLPLIVQLITPVTFTRLLTNSES